MSEIEKTRDLIFVDVVKHFETTGEPMPLRFLSQWYGRKCKVLKTRIIDIVESDPRLIYKVNKRGSRLVMSAAECKTMSDDMVAFRNYWDSLGVSI